MKQTETGGMIRDNLTDPDGGSALPAKREKVFEYIRQPVFMSDDGAGRLTVYDGPEDGRCAEYTDGLHGEETVRISGEEIRLIREAVEDDLLYETNELENPYRHLLIDGTSYLFFFASKGRENEMHGSNIGHYRGDFSNGVHSAAAIRALDRIRDILDRTGIPEKYFEL